MAVRAETDITLTRVDDGAAGANGATFTPSVDAAGDISWTNDGGLPNPQTQNIMGPSGSSGVSVTGVKTQYYLSTSDSSATGGSWDDTPQEFEHSYYYWTRDYIDYSDGTHDTSTPVYNQGLTLANEYALSASSAADNASEYAARALGNLSTVQSVTETLNWIAQHGTMALTTDVALDPTHVYFVVDAGGDYVVGGVTYAVVTEPDVADIGTYYELTIDESLNNYVGTHLALTSEGLWLLPATNGTHKILIATGAGSIYTTAGTYLIDSGGAIVASFRADGATVGKNASGESRSEITPGGMEVIRNVSGTDTQIVNLGFGQGVNDGGSLIYAPYISLGQRKSASTIGVYSVAEGYDTTASGAHSHAEGKNTSANIHQAHAEGLNTVTNAIASHVEGYSNTIANGALYSHAEGQSNTITGNGNSAHVEGKSNTVDDYYAHAEGQLCEASGYASHAEGHYTTASGDRSHSEGYQGSAIGEYSHINGYFTIGDRRSHTVIGECNVRDQAGADETARGDYAFIIGNGTSTSNRSNALEVDWGGNIFMALDTNAGSGTDYDLYTVITALGWGSSVIV